MDLTKMVYDEELDLYYDPEEGRLFRIREYSKGRGSGTFINGQTKTLAQIIWRIMTGEWPGEGYWIVRKDGDKENNAWDNFIRQTPEEYFRENPGSGRPGDSKDPNLNVGVYKLNRRYAVRLKGIYFGTFPTAEEANAFALAKRKELHGDFVRDEDPPCE